MSGKISIKHELSDKRREVLKKIGITGDAFNRNEFIEEFIIPKFREIAEKEPTLKKLIIVFWEKVKVLKDENETTYAVEFVSLQYRIPYIVEKWQKVPSKYNTEEVMEVAINEANNYDIVAILDKTLGKNEYDFVLNLYD